MKSMFGYKPYELYGLFHKPCSNHKQVYAHEQRLGLQGLHNAASTIAHSTASLSLHKAKLTYKGRDFEIKVLLTV